MPWTMTVVFIANFGIAAMGVVLGVLLIIMYVASLHNPQSGDLMPLALFAGIILILGAIILGGVTALLLTRSPLGRIAYTAIMGFGVVLFILMRQYAFPNLLLIAGIVFVWLPASKQYFSDLPGVTYYQNSTTLR